MSKCSSSQTSAGYVSNSEEVSPGEDVFAGVWVSCCSKLSDDHSVLGHGANISISLDIPEERGHTHNFSLNYELTTDSNQAAKECYKT